MADGNGAAPTAFERWELPNVGPEVPSGRRVPSGPLTAAQVEAVQAQAYEEASRDGHAEGFAKGFAEGRAAGYGEAVAVCERLQSIMHCLAEPLGFVDDEVEKALLSLTVSVATQLIRRELAADPEQVLSGIRTALAVLEDQDGEVTLYLHQDDIAALTAHTSQDAQIEGWKLVEDPSLSPGGCRVQRGTSYVDASLEQRLAAVVSQAFGEPSSERS